MTVWQTTRFDVDLTGPRVMGIVNVTPDSFSDGGQHASARQAIEHAQALVGQGAHMLDIGGESTRPGAPTVPADLELARVLPVLREAMQWGVPVSVDTRKMAVMRVALEHGADIINDVSALSDDGALELLAAHGRAGVCLMHMQGTPRTMQAEPSYAQDVVVEVAAYLAARAQAAEQAGIGKGRVVLDPGIGFGKSVAHNFALLGRQSGLLALGYPLLVGWSRKSSLGAVTGRSVNERLPASMAAAVLALDRGASILRVHDVAATIDALAVWQAAHQACDSPSRRTGTMVA